MPPLNPVLLMRQLQRSPRTSSGMEGYLLLARAGGDDCSMDTRRQALHYRWWQNCAGSAKQTHNADTLHHDMLLLHCMPQLCSAEMMNVLQENCITVYWAT